MNPSARAARALLAARAVAAAHGVHATDPRVLHDGVNVVVHLAPAPVVARVATLTPLLRPAPLRSLAREVALAAALAAAGAAVVPPSDALPPGPHRHSGLELTFWRHVTVLPVAPTPAQAAEALAELHGHLAGLPVRGTALDTPLEDLTGFVVSGRAWSAPSGQLDRLAARLDQLGPRLAGEATRLHGDATPGNLLATPDGWAALDAIGGPSDAELTPWLELRQLHAAAWTLVAAAGHPRLRPAADERLAAALGTP
ncbi:phosphotransferase [Geodermatophilus sp. DSM 44513]|uniref:phosphotransferase n=1 Tax=Geodermatophilus sp. DSM 44513 TaxID=1528104 RepID=UPI0012830B1C|nr:phosphotransferase [Geodermatophilus sp. DSM 44513]WNV76360.1 phosphotransferase [Geodermatophilus sp. DSM 44513]